MENPCLNSVRRKIERAQDHLEAITAVLRFVATTETKAVHILVDSDPQRPQQLIITIPKVPPIEPALPLMIGDCIHNLRSALDHLVYQLALQKSAPAESAEKTFFPICLTESQFNDRVKSFVKPFVSESALAELRKSQPYTAYDIPEEADIWILHTLDIIDKHRLLIVAGQQIAVSHFVVAVPTGDRFEHFLPEPKWMPMVDGAEVIRFDLSKAIARPGKVHVQVDALKSVHFINTGLACDGLFVQDVLNQFIGMVIANVQKFGKQFFGE